MDEDIDELELKAFVPVSVRTEDHREMPGNEVSGMLATLPVSGADPVQCLARISAQMRVVKQAGQAIGAQALTELSGFAPPTLLHEAFRLVVTRQRLVNLVAITCRGRSSRSISTAAS
jgi:diacylglycerol O-acyltransferase